MSTLLKSRSFWLAVVAVLQSVVLYFLNVPESIWISINALIAVVIAALTVDDAVKQISAGLKALKDAYLASAKK
jgi:hypothetical protein